VVIERGGFRRIPRSSKFLRAAVLLAALFAGFTAFLLAVHPLPGGYRPVAGSFRSPLSEALQFSAWAFAILVALAYSISAWFSKRIRERRKKS
jgi:membrane protein implicated in regulation of membrane protease activity